MDIEQIVQAAADSQLDDNFLKIAEKPLQNLSKRLNVSPIQAALFAIIAETSFESDCESRDITSHIGCKPIDILQFEDDLKALQKRKLVKAKQDRMWNEGYSYQIPEGILLCLLQNRRIETPKNHGLDLETLLSRLNGLFEERTNEKTSFSAFIDELHELLDGNTDIDFANKIVKLRFKDNELILFLRCCLCYIIEQDEEISSQQLEGLLKSDNQTKSEIIKIRNGQHRLVTDRWIEPSGHELFSGNMFRLTDRAKQELLPKSLIKKAHIDLDELLKSENIAEKRLFYPESDQIQIKRLQGLLQPEAFHAIKERMKAKHMRQGFACLLYGASGTGKTETVLQLARATRRAIMQVNLSELRCMWVGESERKVKAVFDRYRNFVNYCDLEPILLFNEADGIISKRSTDVQRAVDKMENTLQNIILQEMETLEGIMIATTNLTQNMDSAFERRFLYKINFHKPDKACRIRIWQSMMPDLSDNDAAILAERYPFSGGQMENITRKATVESILTGQTPNLEALIQLCEEEHIAENKPRIGF